jgi:hypothetical protein
LEQANTDTSTNLVSWVSFSAFVLIQDGHHV